MTVSTMNWAKKYILALGTSVGALAAAQAGDDDLSRYALTDVSVPSLSWILAG